MTDIVTELRAWKKIGADSVMGRAADEIERLRNERNAFKAKRDQLISISNKLKRERDEARREVCDWCGIFTKETPQVVALKNKWDCFKENA